MPFGRSRRSLPPALRRGFARVAEDVDRAKAALLAAVPSPRGVPGRPLAEAVLEFEEALRRANTSMGEWRARDVELQWEACSAAIEEALDAAERLRLEAPALDYEALVGVLGDLLDPLDAFEEVERDIRGR